MFGKDPAVILNAIAELFRAIIPMLIVFGLIHWTDQQIAAVFLVVGVAVTTVVTVITRSQVVPVEVAKDQIKVAVNSEPGTSVEEVIAATKAKNGV